MNETVFLFLILVLAIGLPLFFKISESLNNIGEGFTNYGITFENTDDVYKGGSTGFEEITLEEVSDLDVWPNNFIRIEFWK